MSNILDRVARLERSEFRPATTDEFFALRLAARLNHSTAARHYVELAGQYSQGQLLSAYRRAFATHLDPVRRFHQLLESVRPNGNGRGAAASLTAIRMERRAIGIAVLERDHLKYADARQLSSSAAKAAETAVGFLHKFHQRFGFQSAAVEDVTAAPFGKRQEITGEVRKALRALAIGIAEVDENDLLAAYGQPSLRFRLELRDVIARIYPVLSQGFGAPWTYDAAALGLFVQTERLFNTLNQSPS